MNRFNLSKHTTNNTIRLTMMNFIHLTTHAKFINVFYEQNV